jgi:hypothetical protein
MFIFRLLMLPWKILFAAIGLGFRTALAVGKAPLKVSRAAVRVGSIRGWVLFIVGLALGLLFAPGPGRELRAKLQALLQGGGAPGEDLQAKVAFELAHAPRTWHLPQPGVIVSGNRVELTGTAATAEDRDELARVAGAIPGVAGVDVSITVPGEDAPSA